MFVLDFTESSYPCYPDILEWDYLSKTFADKYKMDEIEFLSHRSGQKQPETQRE